MTDDPYVYAGTSVLINRFDIREQAALDRIERQFVAQRTRMGVPRGGFDLAHLQAIHRHLFQDVYDWAGEVRQVEISKNGHQFQFCQYIHTGMADVHQRLHQKRFLRNLDHAEFCREAAVIIGDVNYVHPFREGNGRTQRQYLKLLALQAEHPFDLSRFDPVQWRQASRSTHFGEYGEMAKAIEGCLLERDREKQDQEIEL